MRNIREPDLDELANNCAAMDGDGASAGVGLGYGIHGHCANRRGAVQAIN